MAVKLVLEMLNNNEVVLPVKASPLLLGFGRSPMVRQLRITDSPFPLRDLDDVMVLWIKKLKSLLRSSTRN
jgi:hypothetical protein